MSRSLIPASLIQLTALLGEVLGGPIVPNIVLGRDICTLAFRHQVAPLLSGIAESGRHSVPEDVVTDLQRAYRASATRRLAAISVLESIADRFSRSDITWMAFKGTTQAEQLYLDPAWRESSDIDLLVPPDQFGRALDALVAMGFVASYPPVPQRGLFRRMVLCAVRDVMLVARANPTDSVELHRRLFFAEGRHVDFLTLPVTDGRIPVPQIGSDLAFYLIAHGSLSYWIRLKWLVDLVPVLARLKDNELSAIRARASSARSESAAAASLLLLRTLFPFVALGPLDEWITEMSSRKAVRHRFNLYAKSLGSDERETPSPLNDARAMLEAALLVFEAPSTRARILIDAPFSSAMRRLACLIYRTDRSLTLS